MTFVPVPVRRGFEGLLDPIARSLLSARVNPNTVTTFGTLILLASAASYGTGFARLGGVLLLLSGVFDMLDGKVARIGGRMTRFGAFYDSTLDRIGEVALFTGLAIYGLDGGVPSEWAVRTVALCMFALGTSLTVSYARARAEGLGLDCTVGIAWRADRILMLGVPTTLFGAGPQGWLLLAVVAVLALTSAITVVQRVAYVYRITRDDPQEPQIRQLAGKGQSGL